MTIQPRMSFAAMIAKLFKKDNFNVAAAPLMHAAIGIAGETVEAMFHQGQENLKEEFGDLEFYIEAAVQSLEKVVAADGTPEGALEASFIREKYDLLVVQATGNVEEVSMSDLVYFGGEVLDYAKKLWVYNKAVSTVRNDLLQSLANLKAHLLAMYSIMGETEEGIRFANQEKLVYGEKARFKDAAYSDEAANARADKVQ